MVLAISDDLHDDIVRNWPDPDEGMEETNGIGV